MPSKLWIALLLVGAPQSFAMNLQDYLKNVEANHKTVKSLDLSKEAADDRKLSGDLDLVPVLSAGASYMSDKSPLSQFALFGVSETKTTTYNLGFNKKFSTGTTGTIWAQTSEIENVGIQDPQLAAYGRFGFGQMGIKLSQSLWKDFFGASTRLRWERLDAATAAEKGQYDLQKRVLLVQAEAAYWEYLYTVENVKTAQGALERARKIESWTRRRVRDGISDRADLLQGQALVAVRQLELVTAEDDLATAKQAVRDYLELSKNDKFPDLEGNINEARPINALVTGGQGRVVQVEAYLQSLDAKARAVGAQEVDDSYRPDLVLSGEYTTNNLKKDMPEAVQNLTDTNRPTAKVALNFTYMFDTSVKSAARDAARKEALAAKLKAERKLVDSDSSWSELNRQYQEMTKRVQSAEQVYKLQADRARATNDLFNKGRTITMNVVDAENDAATAELNLSRLKSLQRKMEAQGRLYMTVEE